MRTHDRLVRLVDDKLKPVVKKLQSSPAEAGELPEDGLSFSGGNPVLGTGQALLIELAWKIVSGDDDAAETVKTIFAQARDAEELVEDE